MRGHVDILTLYLQKAPLLFTIFQKNNRYRSTTLLFGLGQTIIPQIAKCVLPELIVSEKMSILQKNPDFCH